MEVIVVIVVVLLPGLAISVAWICFTVKRIRSLKIDMPEQSVAAWGLEAGPPGLLVGTNPKIDPWKTEEERASRLSREHRGNI